MGVYTLGRRHVYGTRFGDELASSDSLDLKSRKT